MYLIKDRRSVLALCIVFTLGLMTATQAQTAEDGKALKKLSHEKFLWLVDKDTAKLAMLLEDTMHYIHSNGWIESRNDVLQDLVKGVLKYESVVVEGDTVNWDGPKGVLTGSGIFKVVLDGKIIELKLWYTEVFLKQKDQWKLVHRSAKKL